ncbi:MAG: hypothetical protein ACRDA0_03335 [Cetobacterium sp.]|uniref:hypothetical protein n=1 Tax=Cetobacterium sp. TaxID=2071632 RepID=UPI003F3816DA
MVKFENIHGEIFNWDLEDMFVTTKYISVENALWYVLENESTAYIALESHGKETQISKDVYNLLISKGVKISK